MPKEQASEAIKFVVWFISRARRGGAQYSNLGYIYNVMILRIVLVYQKFLCNRPRFSGFQGVYSLVCFELIFN